MRKLALILVSGLVLLVAFASCGRQQQGRRFVERVGGTNLLTFAAKIGGTNSLDRLADGEFPPQAWPTFLKNSAALSIQPYYSGLQFILRHDGRFESGVYATSNFSEEPEGGSGITFVRLQPGIFWFEQKKRNVAFAEKLLERRSEDSSASRSRGTGAQ